MEVFLDPLRKLLFIPTLNHNFLCRLYFIGEGKIKLQKIKVIAQY